MKSEGLKCWQVTELDQQLDEQGGALRPWSCTFALQATKMPAEAIDKDRISEYFLDGEGDVFLSLKAGSLALLYMVFKSWNSSNLLARSYPNLFAIKFQNRAI